MGQLTRFRLEAAYAAGVREIVETGTGQGASALFALTYPFNKVMTVESHRPLYEENRCKYKDEARLEMHFGDSDDFLTRLAPQIETSRLYFLDAHFYHGADFSTQDTVQTYIASARHEKSFPLVRELQILRSKKSESDWIIIDDARLYVQGAFGAGACPDWAQQFEQLAAVQAELDEFSATHHVHLSRQDHGYWVLIPKGCAVYPTHFLRVLPTDPPGDFPGQLVFRPEIQGATSVSMPRRIRDTRFATRYFKGYGLDVGAGLDSLAMFREFFPLIQNVTPYDKAQGDGQTLINVADASFDFLYSSHCLQQLPDPHEALRNWIRVVKPGGHLIIQVPDEDLFEQGQWPSRYHPDHKHSFTLYKQQSWAPASVNLLELLVELSSQVKALSVTQEDAGYRYGLAPFGIDQTRTPLSESAIELILRKL